MNNFVDRINTESAPKRTMSIAPTRILSEEEIARVKDKVYEDAGILLEEAINRHKNIGSTDIPVYFWILLAWFAIDDIFGWLSSPILFYPLVLLAGIALVMHQLGILTMFLSVVMSGWREKANGFIAMTPIPFRL